MAGTGNETDFEDRTLADYVLAQIAATLRLMFPEQDDFQILQAQA